jgi:hypothetical protein
MTRITKQKNFFESIEKLMSTADIKKSKEKAKKLIFQYRLKELREKQGIKQEEIERFSQPSISRIEKRTDIKLSTLFEYLESIGLNLEITARSKKNPKIKYILLN